MIFLPYFFQIPAFRFQVFFPLFQPFQLFFYFTAFAGIFLKAALFFQLTTLFSQLLLLFFHPAHPVFKFFPAFHSFCLYGGKFCRVFGLFPGCSRFFLFLVQAFVSGNLICNIFQNIGYFAENANHLILRQIAVFHDLFHGIACQRAVILPQQIQCLFIFAVAQQQTDFIGYDTALFDVFNTHGCSLRLFYLLAFPAFSRCCADRSAFFSFCSRVSFASMHSSANF